MMKIIRKKMFETNSSSTHSITIAKKKKGLSWEQVRSEVNQKNPYTINGQIIDRTDKLLVLYQLYLNYYASHKYYLLSELCYLDGIEADYFEIVDYDFDESDNAKPLYCLTFEEYDMANFFLDENKFKFTDEITKKTKEEFFRMVQEIKDLEEEKIQIDQFLDNELTENEKEIYGKDIQTLRNFPNDDEIIINRYFEEGALDFSSGDMDFNAFYLQMKYKAPENTKYHDLEFIKYVINNPDIYFVTKEW